MSAAEIRTGLEIAIVGMAGRFPGANDLAAYWRNLREGVWSVSEFTDAELLEAGVARAVLDAPAYVKANAVVDDAECFDAGYFDYAPREAEMLDPQHRVFLECCAEALAAAGYESDRHPFLTGVYAGANANAYILGLQSGLGSTESTTNLQALLGNDKDYLATRVSYKLNLRGPSVTVQTACSTSLVAVHLACRALLGGECDMALAGGVSIRVPQRTGYLYQEGGLHSPDARCRAFDARAHGTTFGSGVGVVVLKRLDQAIADRDHVHAIILGSAVNNDGAGKVGYTAPSLTGQADVIRAAHHIAGVDARTISFVEAHATGTPLGDPIEVRALTESFRSTTADERFCALGAVKTNFGHLVTAAGIAGLIKTVLSLAHRQIPPTLHFERANPHLDLDSSPFYVNTSVRAWPRGATPRRAGVSSFGVGGTNAHVVVEEAPAPLPPPAPTRPYQVVPLSARSDAAREAMTERLAAALADAPADALPDIAYTLQVGRRSMPVRRVVVARTIDEARAALSSGDGGARIDGAHAGSARPVMLLFPGQGLQHVNMAREVWEVEPVFRSHVDACSDLLRPHLGLDLRSILFAAPEGDERAAALLDETAFAQVALFVVEYALAQQLMAWGVAPYGMIGHSVGEYVAATIAGVFELKDAVALVAERGRLMQALPRGAMAAVALPESEVTPLLGDDLALACVNGPGACVVSGPLAAIDAFERRLVDRGADSRRLRTSHAFHSPMIDPMLPDLLVRLRSMALGPPEIPFVSNVTGEWITADEATDPHYWVRHARGTVRFADGLGAVLRDPHSILIEIGPGQALTAMARTHGAKRPGHLLVDTLGGASDRRSDELVLLQALGRLWAAGVSVDWAAFAAVEQRRRVPLPAYPFERQRYWFSAPAPGTTTSEDAHATGRRDEGIVLSGPAWRQAPLRAAADANLAARRSTWLVFDDGLALGRDLVARLREAHQRVVRVVPADRRGSRVREDGDEYVIDPTDPDAYAVLVRRVGERPEPLTHVVHAWTVLEADGRTPHRSGDACIDRGFHSLLLLAQALGRTSRRDPIAIAVVTSGVHDIAGEAVPCPEHATIAGACKVIPIEYPHFSCRLVDVVLDSRDTAVTGRVAEQVIAECLAHPSDPVVAYRRRDRWVQTWKPLDEHAPPVRRLRDGGVYLITGAFGGVGLQVAEHLAASVPAVKLVLVGRTAPPEPHGWEQWIAEDGGAGARRAVIRRLDEIRRRGASILPVAADVTDFDTMASAVRLALDRFGAIHGVVHAAGTFATDLVQTKTIASAGRVLAPKVRGTRVLEQVFEHLGLDFMVLFSSSLSITGAIGQVDYCAANAFLDAFAHRAAAEGRPHTVSIDWDGWRGIGMSGSVSGSEPGAAEEPNGRALLSRRRSDAAHFATFISEIDAERDWIAAEHVVSGTPTIPGTAFLEIARAAYGLATGADQVAIEHVFFLAPLTLAAGTQRRIQTVLDRDGDGFRFRILSADSPDAASAPTEYARGRLTAAAPPSPALEVRDAVARCARPLAVGDVPRGPAGQVVQWGPRWNNVRAVHAGDGEIVVVQQLADEYVPDLETMLLHPALLDVATAMMAITSGLDDYIPVSYGRVSVHGRLTPTIYSHARRQASGPGGDAAAFAVTIYDADRRPVVRIDDFVMVPERRLNPGSPHAGGDAPLPSSPAAAGRSIARHDEIDADAALAAFDRILSLPAASQVVVSAEDIHVRLARLATTADRPVRSAETSSNSGGGSYPRPALATAYAAPATETEERVAAIWQEALGIDRVGANDDFFELGGHSLLAAHVIDRLCSAFGVDISLSTVLGERTVARTARFVDQARQAREHARQAAILERLAALSEDDAADELRRYSV